MLTHWETHQASKNQLLILYIKEKMMLVYIKGLRNLKRLQKCKAPAKLADLSTNGISLYGLSLFFGRLVKIVLKTSLKMLKYYKLFIFYILKTIMFNIPEI